MNIIKITDNDGGEHRFGVESAAQVSDGYHTIVELYDHRITLFIALCRIHARLQYSSCSHGATAKEVWRSKRHSDGELAFGGDWFVLGIGKKPGEQITYHLPISRWDEIDFVETLDKAPPLDGHTSADVLERLKRL